MRMDPMLFDASARERGMSDAMGEGEQTSEAPFQETAVADVAADAQRAGVAEYGRAGPGTRRAGDGARDEGARKPGEGAREGAGVTNIADRAAGTSQVLGGGAVEAAVVFRAARFLARDFFVGTSVGRLGEK